MFGGKRISFFPIIFQPITNAFRRHLAPNICAVNWSFQHIEFLSVEEEMISFGVFEHFVYCSRYRPRVAVVHFSCDFFNSQQRHRIKFFHNFYFYLIIVR